MDKRLTASELLKRDFLRWRGYYASEFAEQPAWDELHRAVACALVTLLLAEDCDTPLSELYDHVYDWLADDSKLRDYFRQLHEDALQQRWRSVDDK